MFSGRLTNVETVPSWRLQNSRVVEKEQGPRAGVPGTTAASAREPLKVVYVGISGVLHPIAWARAWPTGYSA